MLFREMPTLALWHLHHGSGRSLASVIIPMIERGLQVHVFACRGPDGTPTVAILGMDEDGVSRSYAEVVLTDLDPVSIAAWTVLKADDTIARARQRLVEVDAILNGTAVPRRDTGKAS